MSTKRRPLLLGKRHEAPLRRVIAHIDPFKHYHVDEQKSSWVHDAFTVFFLGLMLAYTVVAFMSYVNRDEVEVFSLVAAKDLEPLDVDVSAVCDPGLCTTLTVAWDYTNTDSACVDALRAARGGVQGSHVFAEGAGSVNVPVCPVADAGDDGVQLDWALTGPPATPDVKALVTLRAGDLDSTTMIQHWHLKNVVLGTVVKRKGDDIDSRSAYVSAVQYVGVVAGPNARMGISMDQFAQQYEVKRPGSLLEVLASIGGAASLILPFMRITTWAVAKWDHHARLQKRRERKQQQQQGTADAGTSDASEDEVGEETEMHTVTV